MLQEEGEEGADDDGEDDHAMRRPRARECVARASLIPGSPALSESAGSTSGLQAELSRCKATLADTVKSANERVEGMALVAAWAMQDVAAAQQQLGSANSQLRQLLEMRKGASPRSPRQPALTAPALASLVPADWEASSEAPAVDDLCAAPRGSMGRRGGSSGGARGSSRRHTTDGWAGCDTPCWPRECRPEAEGLFGSGSCGTRSTDARPSLPLRGGDKADMARPRPASQQGQCRALPAHPTCSLSGTRPPSRYGKGALKPFTR